MRCQQLNNGIIERAFRRLSANEEKIVADGMCRLAKAGLEYLVEAHDFAEVVLNHPNESNTVAYAVAKDGAIVRGEYLDNNNGRRGDALEQAKALLSGTKGWNAIIISDMKGWYNVAWEMDFLHYSVAQIKADFHKFFKKIK